MTRKAHKLPMVDAALPDREGLNDSYVRRLVRLAFLSPTIIEAICAGWHSEPQIVVNFGLNSGSGAVGLTRLEGAKRSRWIYTVNGQVVNIAARIVAEAKGGKILIGPETERRIRDRVKTLPVGGRRLKGISVDVELFSVD